MDESKHRKENGLDKNGTWMFIELLGHKKLAGFVTSEEKWGQVLLRIDIPTSVKDGKMQFTTQFYGTHALYCATPINETDAIQLAKQFRPSPFGKYDLHRETTRNLDDYKITEKTNNDPDDDTDDDTDDDIPF